MFNTLCSKVSKRKPKVAIIYPPPYPARLPILDLICKNTDSIVLFFAKHSLLHPDWEIDGTLKQFQFRYRFIPGIQLKRRGMQIRPFVLWYLWCYKPYAIVTSEFNLQTLFALIYARLFRSKILIQSELTRHTNGRHRAFRKWLVRNCDGFIACSSETKKYLCDLDAKPEAVFISFHLPDLLSWKLLVEKEKKSRDILRAELGLKGKIFLYVGRIEPVKGLELLLIAFHRSKRNMQNASIVLVGSGSEEGKLREYCEQNNLSDRVIFTGYKQPGELPRYYAAADAFVLPSLWEPFGIVVGEALASGLPVICSSFAGAADLIQEGKNGYILDPHDTEKFAAILSSLIMNDDLLESLKQGALESIENFTVEKNAEQFLRAIAFAMRTIR
jgi:glycosyltransferase involved in cell wall biosynthesis